MQTVQANPRTCAKTRRLIRFWEACWPISQNLCQDSSPHQVLGGVLANPRTCAKTRRLIRFWRCAGQSPRTCAKTDRPIRFRKGVARPADAAACRKASSDRRSSERDVVALSTPSSALRFSRPPGNLRVTKPTGRQAFFPFSFDGC